MSYLKIYQKDFKVILGAASILPVVCFVGGFYIGSSGHTRQSVDETLSERPIGVQDADVADRSELGDLYSRQNENDPQQGLNHQSSLSQEHDGVKRGIVEHGDLSKDSGANLADAMDAQRKLQTDSRRGEAGNLTGKVSAKPEPAVQNITSRQGLNEYLVQAGRFSSYDNASKFQDQLEVKHLQTQIVLDDSTAQPGFLVIVTSFATKEEAKRYCLIAEKRYQLDFYVKNKALDLKKSSEAVASL